MNDSDPSSFAQLFEQLLEGTIDDASRQRLFDRMEAEPSLRVEAMRQLKLDGAIEDFASARDDEHWIRVITEHAFHLGTEDDQAFVSRVVGKLERRRRFPVWSAVAALVVFSATATFFIVRPNKLTEAKLATMIELDEDGRIVSSSDLTGGFNHTAKNGLFRLNFTNGAVVAIEAPASFEVLNGSAMRLASGKLNAWCPDAAHGFQVLTSNTTVTDLGTSFGVSADTDGSADIMVLDGLVNVSMGTDTRRLAEGEALRTDAAGGLQTVAFRTDDFSRTWPLASGIVSAGGSVKPAPPGTSEQLSRLEDDKSVLVIPEKRSVPFEQPIHVELEAPGEISLKHPPVMRTLVARPGTRLRSFLIRYNPVGRPKNRVERFEGEVTFDRPVLAICASSPALVASDPIFATGPWSGTDGEAEFRGIDLDQPRSADTVWLSKDRRTVRIVFNASLSTDDLRVIIEEEGAGR